MEITELQHSDSIWIWKSSARNAKVTLWLPYLQKIEKIKGKTYRFIYKGGEVNANLTKVDCIMLYGASGMLDVEFLDNLCTCRIPLLIHRRNMDQPMMFLPALRPDENDILGRQVLLRQNQPKATYIARTLILARFAGVGIDLGLVQRRKLNSARNLTSVRILEAELSRRYWQQFFKKIGNPKATRREKSPITAALDAGSYFLFGIILRWVLVHRLSPTHGFLHTTTAYPALIYDLIEPYRYLIEEATTQAATELETESEKLTAATLVNIKKKLEETVYVPMTKQYVRRKNLLHGGVLALRAYLSGDMQRLVIPMEGIKKGGRPPKVSYAIPGGRGRLK